MYLIMYSVFPAPHGASITLILILSSSLSIFVYHGLSITAPCSLDNSQKSLSQHSPQSGTCTRSISCTEPYPPTKMRVEPTLPGISSAPHIEHTKLSFACILNPSFLRLRTAFFFVVSSLNFNYGPRMLTLTTTIHFDAGLFPLRGARHPRVGTCVPLVPITKG